MAEIKIDATLEKIKGFVTEILELTEAQQTKYTKTRGVELRKALDKLCNEKVAIKREIFAYESSITKKKDSSDQKNS